MTWKFSDFCKIGFMFMGSFMMAFHYASVKSHPTDRSIASETHHERPMYDASFKY